MAKLKKAPTIAELIEAQKQEIGQFKEILDLYAEQNPLKSAAKQSEFSKKLELKEARLLELETIAANMTQADRDKELRAQKDVEDAETQRQADLEQARKEGYEQALKEQGQAKQAASTK